MPSHPRPFPLALSSSRPLILSPSHPQVFEAEKRIFHEEGLDPGEINFTDNAMVLEVRTPPLPS
jgi:hypothetical protein